MKKIILSLSLIASLTACQAPSGTSSSTSPSPSATPSGSATVGVKGNLSTKAKYMDFINCVNNQPGADALLKANIASQMNTLASVDESNWAIASVTFKTFFETNSAAYPACKE